MVTPLPERIGRYEVITVLGEGGLATVYLGRARGPGGYQREVAIKVLHPHLRSNEDLVDQLITEAKIVSMIRHPNIVQILDVDSDDSGVFVVMEHVAGSTLSTLMSATAKRGAIFPPAVAMRILIDTLAGLHAAHDLVDANALPLDLVHRDVSPQNIIVSTDGTARLIDFGIAKFARREFQTRTGLIKGKASYMAPEQARGRDLDRRCDIWAAGVVAWELMAGRRLFKTDDEMTTLFEVVSGTVPALSSVVELSPALEAAIASALRRDVEQRCPSAQAFSESLADTGEDIATTTEVAAFVMQASGQAIRAEQERVASALLSATRSRAVHVDEEAEGQHAVDGDTGGRDGQTSTTHELSTGAGSARASTAGRRARWLAGGIAAAAVAATVVALRGSVDTARSATAPPVESPESTVSASSTAHATRLVTVTANAPIKRLVVNREPVVLPLAADRVTVEVAAKVTTVAIEAEASDGRIVRHVSASGRNEVVLRFEDPKLRPSAMAAANNTTPTGSSSALPPKRWISLPKPRKPVNKTDPPIGPSPYVGQ